VASLSIGTMCFHLSQSHAPTLIPDESIVKTIGLVLISLKSSNALFQSFQAPVIRSLVNCGHSHLYFIPVYKYIVHCEKQLYCLYVIAEGIGTKSLFTGFDFLERIFSALTRIQVIYDYQLKQQIGIKIHIFLPMNYLENQQNLEIMKA
jgi:hypothetical protein